jgi:hypothetical protein
MSEAIAERKLRGSAAAVGEQMAKAKQELMELYVRHHSMTREQALSLVNQQPPAQRAEELMKAPPSRTSWHDLNELSEIDPTLAAEKWEDMIDAATDELASGDWAAQAAIPPEGNCWSRAQFVALRENLAEEWNPRNGIERALIDMMAQALSLRMRWMQQLVVLGSLEASEQKPLGKYQPPRATMFAAIEQSAAMADRFDRMFMRALRQLRDLRRYTIVIQSAGQVNIAEQQVNNPAPK